MAEHLCACLPPAEILIATPPTPRSTPNQRRTPTTNLRHHAFNQRRHRLSLGQVQDGCSSLLGIAGKCRCRRQRRRCRGRHVANCALCRRALCRRLRRGWGDGGLAAAAGRRQARVAVVRQNHTIDLQGKMNITTWHIDIRSPSGGSREGAAFVPLEAGERAGSD